MFPGACPLLLTAGWPLVANPNRSCQNVNSVRTLANMKNRWQGGRAPLATWLY
jgi:hypothetical protein